MKYKIINGAITLGDNTILEEVNIDINDGERIGIVGKNGAGKTTLLKALIDNTLFSEGIGEEKFQIIKFGNFSIGYQEQIKFVNESTTLYEELLSSFKDLVDMEKLLNKYLDNMNVNPSTENILKYTELENQFKILGGYEYKCECEVILDKFKFTKEDKTKRIKEFSGGEKTKIAFMKLLLQKPDLLILDEPTNHLDLDTILWLEKYLENYKKTLIVVSHDRAFLNNIVNVIYDIEYGKTTKYVGNYEKYEKLKKERYDKLLYDYEMQQKEIKRLTAIYERFRFKPAKAKMALAKLHQIERMDLLDKPRKEDLKVFKVNLDKIEKTGRIAFKTKNLCVGYNIPLARINVEVASESRLGIIGKNGTGKSTFLKTIYDLIPALSGKYQFGVNANIGYFDQSLANISGEKTVLE
jgi:ATP-binding cassette subfamily F protein 3